MNRRGFIASALAAPIAAVIGWKSKGPVGFWGHEIVKRAQRPGNHPTATGTRTFITHEDRLKVMREITKQAGESSGSSFSFVKSKEASEIIQKAHNSVKW